MLRGQDSLPRRRFFFSDNVRAASFSAHLTGENLFLELRVLGAVERSAEAIQKQMRERVEHLASDAETYLAGLNLQPYGRQVLLRFPQMLRVMTEFTAHQCRKRPDRDAVLLAGCGGPQFARRH